MRLCEYREGAEKCGILRLCEYRECAEKCGILRLCEYRECAEKCAISQYCQLPSSCSVMVGQWMSVDLWWDDSEGENCSAGR